MSALSRYTLPSPEEEVWRYSRIAELDLDAYTPAAEAPVAAGIPAPIEAALETAGYTVQLVR